MKAYWGVDIYTHVFLISALVRGEWSASHPCHFTPKETAPGTYWMEGWMDSRAGQDEMEKLKFLTLPGLELHSLGSPAGSQSIYRLLYSSSYKFISI
jgi:hypothetical protein